MLLLRLSGHSGAGKSRLTAALPRHGISSPRALLYTSRERREGEIDGRDYHFRSREVIEALPPDSHFVGPVRDMLQAVDLNRLEADLRKNDLVLIEIFDKLWPGVERAITDRSGRDLRVASVFMTAVDPTILKSMPSDRERAACIEAEVERILRWRHKDPLDKIQSRAMSAVQEVLAAIAPGTPYHRVFLSAPEGPDGQDDWTQPGGPVSRAAQVLNEFVEFVRSFR